MNSPYDAKTRQARLIALVLAWNTPLYPLYVLAVAGAPSRRLLLLHLLVLPAFVAILPLSRRNPRAARMLLVIAGTLNTMLCIRLYGEAAATQLFLLPCATVAIMLFYPSERRTMLAMLALPLIAYALLGHEGTAWLAYTPAQYHHLAGLNAASVGSFTIFLAWIFA